MASHKQSVIEGSCREGDDPVRAGEAIFGGRDMTRLLEFTVAALAIWAAEEIAGGYVVRDARRLLTFPVARMRMLRVSRRC